MEHRRLRPRILAAVAVGLSGLVVAGFLIARAFGDRPAAAPPAPASSAQDPRRPPVAPAPWADALPPSVPVRLDVPRIGVRTPLMKLAQNADRTVETPPPDRAQEAGWYRLGAAPGSRGAAVIIGHLDTARGPAVFYRLGELRPGDQATVLRSDGRTAVFEIDSIERVDKKRFPTGRVYGDPGYAAIRLITCAGRFDRAIGDYTHNVIAYGRLVRTDGASTGAR
ncbi:class F sortase [Actinomadura decatromicini]|uniref:Class F sortase n=1 Tax=Actinomadura decatromicini TaxID=2604572 RepID=A0A5D3FH55_9ACTN|nr:class F sortase [Actinomadura decatromicini]TYK47196.1 class F sortase [Actinomadura decatromicini]